MQQEFLIQNDDFNVSQNRQPLIRINYMTNSIAFNSPCNWFGTKL